jgi:hypothetical protein
VLVVEDLGPQTGLSVCWFVAEVKAVKRHAEVDLGSDQKAAEAKRRGTTEALDEGSKHLDRKRVGNPDFIAALDLALYLPIVITYPRVSLITAAEQT